MTDHIDQLIQLVNDYEAAHGKGKGWEVFGSLLISHGVHGQIDVFEKAQGRAIILEADPDHPDADLVVILYQPH